MKAQTWIVLGCGWLVALGLGYGARRLRTEEPPPPRVAETAPAPRPAGDAAEPATGPEIEAESRRQVDALMKSAASTRSGDTLETILRIDPVAEYARLALWMVDASADEIGAYWDHYRGKENRSNDINDLIFINWTRLDPAAAVARSTGTPDEHYAWWAWACHDPATAFQEAMANNPERINNVTWALGEFHAEWAREHFDEIPEENRYNVFQGMVKWDDAADPGLILDFLQEKGRGTDTRMFKALIRKDPWAAYDRVLATGARATASADPFADNGQGSPMELLITNMAEFHPDLLSRMAQLTQPGELKRKMEASAFESLLEKDPDEAIRQASEEKAPAIAAGYYAKAAAALLDTSPDRAFEMAGRMFGLPSAAWSGAVEIEHENGRNRRGGGGVDQSFLASLVARDAERTMDLARAAGASSKTAVAAVAEQWAGQDVYGFAEWVSEQPASEERSSAAGVLMHRLNNDGMHADAIEWCVSDDQLRPQLQWMFQHWIRSDPAAAREWAEGADLTESERENLEPYLKR